MPSATEQAGFTFGPLESTLLTVALVMAALSLMELVRVARREILQRRIGELSGSPSRREAPAASQREHRWYQRVAQAMAMSPLLGTVEQTKLLGALSSAGIRGSGRLATFISLKTFGLIVLPILVWAVLDWRNLMAGALWTRFPVLHGAMLFGWRAPDIVVARMAKQRKFRIETGIPDALDLLVICAEAGLGLEQGIEQVGRDLRPSNPDVAEEFATTAAEMRVLPDRRVALENLAERTGLETLGSLVATLVQSIRFGTPLTDSLRVLATEMRAVRMTRFEERAARLPVLLTIPLLAFIMPSLFLVLLGPVALRVMDSLHRGGHP